MYIKDGTCTFGGLLSETEGDTFMGTARNRRGGRNSSEGETENGSFQVHAGPKRFLLGNDLTVSKGDQIQAVGSRIVYKGHDALIPRRVVLGN